MLAQLQSIFSDLTSHITTNQFASGGLLLGVGGIIIAYLRNIPNLLGQKLLRLISIEVQVSRPNELFSHLNNFFADKQPAKYSRNFKATYSQKDTIEESIKISLGEGTHMFFYKGILMICSRAIRKDSQNNSSEQNEYFTIRLFTRSKEKMRKFLMEATLSAEPDYSNIKIYQTDRWGDSWDLIKRAKVRSAKHIVLPEGTFDFLVKDIEHFYTSEKWFEELGIPHKRGYLFYGPPGNGKTSTIVCLASHFSIPVYLIPKLNDTNIEKMCSLFSELPKRAFVVFEDIDAMLHKGRKKSKSKIDDLLGGDEDKDVEKESDEEKKINFSGLLNALDGITTPEGHIIFMTTNHPENLDAALIRPGRIDRKVAFNNPDAFQMGKIYQKFFPQASPKDLEDFTKVMLPQSPSASELQEFLLKHRTVPEALQASTDLLKKEKKRGKNNTKSKSN
jgi:mitochondrial chaperone BCS1